MLCGSLFLRGARFVLLNINTPYLSYINTPYLSYINREKCCPAGPYPLLYKAQNALSEFRNGVDWRLLVEDRTPTIAKLGRKRVF